MKTKKLMKSLVLKKLTIADLQKENLDSIKGGTFYTDHCTTIPCTVTSCNPEKCNLTDPRLCD